MLSAGKQHKEDGMKKVRADTIFNKNQSLKSSMI
jgi:hypothetical protein